jgi:hypothetical protein
LNGYEHRVRTKCDQFVAQLSKTQEPLDATAWSMYLAFDIMGEVAFGKDFGGVTTGTEHAAIKGIHESMGIIGIFSHVSWFINIAARIPGALSGYVPFMKWCAAQVKARQKVLLQIIRHEIL